MTAPRFFRLFLIAAAIVTAYLVIDYAVYFAGRVSAMVAR